MASSAQSSPSVCPSRSRSRSSTPRRVGSASALNTASCEPRTGPSCRRMPACQEARHAESAGEAYGHSVDVEVAPPSLWDGHLVLLYRSEREYDDNLGAWIRRGLDRAERVVLTSRPAEPQDRVLRLCANAGVDAIPAQRIGQL